MCSVSGLASSSMRQNNPQASSWLMLLKHTQHPAYYKHPRSTIAAVFCAYLGHPFSRCCCCSCDDDNDKSYVQRNRPREDRSSRTEPTLSMIFRRRRVLVCRTYAKHNPAALVNAPFCPFPVFA